MRARRADILSILTIIFVIGIFFFRWFYPVQRILTTPDFGRSDAWHFSFPTKFALAQAIEKNQLPLWRDDIGDGFPLFAEGQTGALFLPNQLAFRLFPPDMAYGLLVALTPITFALGLYLWLRGINVSPMWATYASIAGGYSGLMITQLPHITLLQGMSLMPWVLWATSRMRTNTRMRSVALLAFLVHQQNAAGFPQATFLTLILCASLICYDLIQKKTLHTALVWALGVGLGIAASAWQILPSYEFLRASTDQNGFDPATATTFSFPLRHLASFILPTPFGNPKLGTYPPFTIDGSIFWEVSPYLGIITVFFALAGVLAYWRKPFVRFFCIVLFASLLLAGGKFAPTYILFSVWPMTLFRVPARFLWIAIVCVLTLGSMGGNFLSQKSNTAGKILIGILAVTQIGFLISAFWSYHTITPAKQIVSRPDIYKDNPVQGRIMSIGYGQKHNEIFLHHGWSGKEQTYEDLTQLLSPDSNMLWNIHQHQIYAGRFLNRPTLVNTMMEETILQSPDIATLSASTFTDMFAISDILSAMPIDSDVFRLASSRDYTSGLTLYHYQNTHPSNRARVVYEATSAATLTDAYRILRSDSFSPQDTVLLESHQTKEGTIRTYLSTSTAPLDPENRIVWEQNTHQAITLSVTSSADGILVLADTYYPGWVARIDGKETPIYAANITQRAVILPKGTHAVTFTYEPTSVRTGRLISLISYWIIILLVALPSVFSAVHTRKITPARASYRRRTTRT